MISARICWLSCFLNVCLGTLIFMRVPCPELSIDAGKTLDTGAMLSLTRPSPRTTGLPLRFRDVLRPSQSDWTLDLYPSMCSSSLLSDCRILGLRSFLGREVVVWERSSPCSLSQICEADVVCLHPSVSVTAVAAQP